MIYYSVMYIFKKKTKLFNHNSEVDGTQSDLSVTYDDSSRYYFGPNVPQPPRSFDIRVEITTDNYLALEKKFFCDKPSEKYIKRLVCSKLASNFTFFVLKFF